MIYIFLSGPLPLHMHLLSTCEQRGKNEAVWENIQSSLRGSAEVLILAPAGVALCDHEGFLVCWCHLHDSQKTLRLRYLKGN